MSPLPGPRGVDTSKGPLKDAVPGPLCMSGVYSLVSVSAYQLCMCIVLVLRACGDVGVHLGTGSIIPFVLDALCLLVGSVQYAVISRYRKDLPSPAPEVLSLCTLAILLVGGVYMHLDSECTAHAFTEQALTLSLILALTETTQ
ncbi:hypothetical protein KIPB_009249, partial [Kipferlia bialata]|eukprot:g9249.t1